MSFGIGDTVGTYKIVAGLGSGGTGEVFRVEHSVTHRVEAMKVLAAATPTSPEHDRRFLREIQVQAGLSHPNIAAVHNAFWDDSHLIMIMELIEGASLRDLLEGGKIPLAMAIDYASQALSALQYAHTHGVVHRDISPANMIITKDGKLKLTDFGLAKSLKDIRLTQTGALIGSLYYTSPEQVRGDANVDARSDIYSMGAVMYEMVTGVKVFSSDNPFTLMLAHVEQAPRRPSEVEPALPQAVNEILLKSLDKDPENRFQSAELYRRALESAKDALSVHSGQKAFGAVPAGNGTVGQPTTGRPHWVLANFHAGVVPLAIRRSPLAKAAVVLLCAILLSYGWKAALFPGSNAPPAPPDFASLPVIWPANLMPIPSLTLAAADIRLSRPFGQLRGAGEDRVRQDNPPRRKNPFFRAMDHVVHPFRRRSDPDRSTAAAKVSSEPSIN